MAFAASYAAAEAHASQYPAALSPEITSRLESEFKHDISSASSASLEPPHRVQEFRFTKVDLELLRQANGFDRYIEEKGWIYDDSATNEYLQQLGLSLVPMEALVNVTWRFRAIRDLDVNAFALPNGSIYIDSGLLARMENEAQLAGVLAHEVTHVVNRHSYLANRSSRKKMVAIDIILAGASAASYGGVNRGIVSVVGNVLPMILVTTIYGYSRQLEREADAYAVNKLYLQNYDLRQFARGFELLRKGPEVDLNPEPVFWSSHPKLVERVRYIVDQAEQLQPTRRELRVNDGSYRAATRNVTRHHAAMAILLGQPRTALAIAQRLIAEEPGNPENFVLLGDAYRTLGARTPAPSDQEQTEEAKIGARTRLRKMTREEYDKALLADLDGESHWQSNFSESEKAFQKALEMDPQNATAHRGLGFLYESEARSEAVTHFKRYLQAAPDALDARQIRIHLEALESTSMPADAVPRERTSHH